MATTPADPGAIDLEAIRESEPSIGNERKLIAAVEALRERVAELEAQLSDVKLLAACKRVVTAEMRVTELEGILEDTS